jgi:hypothetical protein
MPAIDWFIDYVADVIRTTRSGLLPDDPADPFWAPMEQAFARSGVRHGAALRALEGMEAPPESPAPFRAALIAAARACSQQEANATATDGGEMDRDAAFARSWDCPECAGQGLTSREVYSRKFDRRARVGCICHLCPMGRWVARQHQGKESRLVDLSDHPALQWDADPDAEANAGEGARSIWERVKAGGPAVRRVSDELARPAPRPQAYREPAPF